MLSYPEIRGVLAQLEEEYNEMKKHPQNADFGSQAQFIVAIIDRRLREKIKEKYDKGQKNLKF